MCNCECSCDKNETVTNSAFIFNIIADVMKVTTDPNEAYLRIHSLIRLDAFRQGTLSNLHQRDTEFEGTFDSTFENISNFSAICKDNIEDQLRQQHGFSMSVSELHLLSHISDILVYKGTVGLRKELFVITDNINAVSLILVEEKIKQDTGEVSTYIGQLSSYSPTVEFK